MTRSHFFLNFLFSILVVLYGCSSNEDYGTGLVPEDQFLNGIHTDTFQIEARMVYSDTIRMDEPQFAILGQSYDPIFGICRASFYINFAVTSPVQSYGPNPTIDSVVLVLKFEDLYGNRSKLFGYQTIKVYELLDPIPEPPEDGFTNFNTSFQTLGQPVGEKGFAPIFPLQGSDGRVFKIPLSPEIGTRFLNADSLNNNNIEDLLKGLYLTCEAPGQQPGEGSLMKFDTKAGVSGIYFYYDTDNQENQLVRITTSGSLTRTINKSDYDRTTAAADLKDKLEQENFDYQNQPDLYIQPLQGLRIYVKIPHLLNLLNQGQVVVNRAELLVPVKTEIAEDYSLPGTLLTYYKNSIGTLDVFSDLKPVGTSNPLNSDLFYDGIYRSSMQAYRFRITRHIQDLLDGHISPDPGFYLDHSLEGKDESFSRVVVRGPLDPIEPMKLSIIYTLVN